MYRSEINTLKKCVKLVTNTNYTKTHGQQNMKLAMDSKALRSANGLWPSQALRVVSAQLGRVVGRQQQLGRGPESI